MTILRIIQVLARSIILVCWLACSTTPLPCEESDDCLAPALISLRANKGTLIPKFSPSVHNYTLELSLLEHDVELVAKAAAPTTIVNVDDGSENTSAVTFIASKHGDYNILLEDEAGRSSTYSVTVSEKVGLSHFRSEESGNRFGWSLDLDNDVMIVGAATATTSRGSRSGAAHIYRYRNGGWKEEALLVPDSLSPGDRFGTSVAISGNRALVGAPETKVGSAPWAGAVYVFEYEESEWKEVFVLHADPQGDDPEGDRFGYSVALDGEVAVVGAYGGEASDNEASSDYGAAHVFRIAENDWKLEDKFVPSHKEGNPRYGARVAVSGDTVAVAARFDSANTTNGGAVYLYSNVAGQWVPGPRLTRQHPDKDDYFGTSLDINAGRLIVGAQHGGERRDDNSNAKIGAAYIFEATPEGWKQTARLMSSDSIEQDYFGFSVAIEGNNVMVGAPIQALEDTLGSGATYHFYLDGSQWVQSSVLAAPLIHRQANFGWALAMSRSKAVVATGYDNGTNNFIATY